MSTTLTIVLLAFMWLVVIALGIAAAIGLFLYWKGRRQDAGGANPSKGPSAAGMQRAGGAGQATTDGGSKPVSSQGHPPHQAAPPPVRMVVVRGKSVPTSLDLPDHGITIGRHPTNRLALDNPLVSRRHAKVEFDDNCWTITDLGSSNGTYVNGVRVERHQLHPGDLVMIGGSIIVFQKKY